MEEFCGEPLLSLNSSWHTSSPELPQCLSRTVLLAPPSLLLLASLLSSFFSLAEKQKPAPSLSRPIIARILLATLALVLTVVQATLESKHQEMTGSDILYMVVTVLVLLASAGVEVLHQLTFTYSSGLQFSFWLLQVVCAIPAFKYDIDNISEGHHVEVSAVSCAYFSTLLLLILSQWFPNWRSDHPSEDKEAFAAWITFGWMSPCFLTGYKKSLGHEDLPIINWRLGVSYILNTFLKNHRSQQKDQKKSTLTVLIKSFGSSFAVAAFLRLVNDILLYMTPLVFRKIINTVESDVEGEEESWKGFMWCGLLLITATAQITVSNHYFRQSFVAAFQMRTAIASAIYRKTLTISNSSRSKFSTGEITNLMSIDSQRFVEIVPYLNTVWSGPFQFFLAIYFLYDLVGWSAMAGLGVFAILIPINMWGGTQGRKIQQEQMKAKDSRILLMNEVLQGMKVLKLYAWEKPLMEKVTEARNQEIKSIKKQALLTAVMWITYAGAPLVVTLTTFMLYVLIDPNHVLTAEKVFGTVAVFNVVRIPMSQFPRFLMEAVKLHVSLKRIDDYLNCDDLEEEKGHSGPLSVSKNSITMKEAAFSWLGGSHPPTLEKLDLNIKQGELVAVVGKIGSGKSSLLAAILGELNKVRGSSRVEGRVAYVAQQAWIQNMTVRDNILFGSEYNAAKYQQVVEACALLSDLEILPAGDQTEIGENGVNLSGGQKQRVGLARAAYQGADIILLDDPLSAVDAHVGKHLMDKLLGPEGLLKDKTRVLVTHNLGFLHKMDTILVMDGGVVQEQGSLDQLSANEGSSFSEFSSYVGKEGVEEEAEKTDDKKDGDTKTEKKENGKMMTTEKKAEGRVSVKHYKYYIQSMNTWMFVLVVMLFLGAEAFKVGSNLVLAEWTQNFNKDTNWNYIGYYSLLGFFTTLVGMFSTIGSAFRGAAASKKIHEALLLKTMHAPLSFFETTPIGRILNRFTSDLDVIDMKIPQQLRAFLSCIAMIGGTFFVVTVVTPYFLIPLGPILVVYFFLQIYFTRTRRQVKRLESIAKSPIFSHFTETIQGATTIRAFDQQDRFFQENEARVTSHLQCNYISDMSNRWLSIRVEFLGNFIVFFAAIFAFYLRDSIPAGVIALSISYAMQMIDGFGWTIRMAGELESDSVALERIREYEDLPQEAEWESEQPVPENWPSSGEVQFERYATKYRPELPCVLNNFNLSVGDNEKVGIVGRTGAGKSSLSLALFRIIEPTEGTITISGRDITTIGLQDLRARLTIIPQEPTLFSGTLRFNLDPGGDFTDDAVHRALQSAGLSGLVAELAEGLEHKVAEGGAGLSLGQRQLICLARALLRRSKVLVLDEATAAVDTATDDRIQHTIRTEFANCTVLTIAHRLNTVTGGDTVLVLDRGELVEQGSPTALMEEPSTQFHGMARAAGILN